MAVQAPMSFDNIIGFPLGGASQDWPTTMVNNNGGANNSSDFYFVNLHQKQHQPYLNNMQPQQLPDIPILQGRNQDSRFRYNNLTSPDNRSLAFSHSIASQMEKQRMEIDLLINLQKEKLRLALQEQRKQQVVLLLKNYESNTRLLFQQKDEEIANARNRTMELEQLTKTIENENETWQRVAKENEAIIVSLKNTMEKLREGAGQSGNEIEDAESCCEIGMGSAPVMQIQTGVRLGEEHKTRNMMCKSCHLRYSCVILLPCRHLCSCSACEAFIQSCPVCNMVKKASIEALI